MQSPLRADFIQTLHNYGNYVHFMKCNFEHMVFSPREDEDDNYDC